MLLRPVMKVPLDAPSLVVLRHHEALARAVQFRSLAFDLLEPLPELFLEAEVTQHEGRFARHNSEELDVLVPEGMLRSTADHDETDEVTGRDQRGHQDRLVSTHRTQRGRDLRGQIGERRSTGQTGESGGHLRRENSGWAGLRSRHGQGPERPRPIGRDIEPDAGPRRSQGAPSGAGDLGPARPSVE